MPVSPFNFATIAASSQNKVFGGNIVQVPVGDGGPSTAYSYGFLFINWSTYYSTWVLPQIKNWKRRGGTTIRLIGAVDVVLLGTLSQSAYEAALTQVIGDIRALGLTLSVAAMAIGTSYSTAFGALTAAQIFAPTQSALTNVLIPNQDVVAYIEAGNQESDLFGDLTMSNALATLALAATTIPVLESCTGGSFSGYNTSCNLFGLHVYPDFGHGTTDFNGLFAYLTGALRTTGGVPILVEEAGVRNVTYQAKSDFMDNLFAACFGHPNVVGVLIWGGQGPTSDGDWTLWTPPASPYVAGTDWTDTAASITYASWGAPNRRLSYVMSLDGSQSVTATAANLNLNAASASVSAPVITDINLSTHIYGTSNCSFSGTFSLTGDPGSQYTVQFAAYDQTGNAYHTIGSAVVVTGSVTNQALVASGQTTFSSDWLFFIRAQLTSGATNGTMTAVAGTVTIGTAPSLLPPSFGVGQFSGLLLTEGLAWSALAAAEKNPAVTRRGLLRGAAWLRH